MKTAFDIASNPADKLWSITLILSCVFLLGCGEKESKPIIPVDTMVKVLSDVHMAEGALLNVRYAIKDSMRLVYYDQIYEIHEISEESFRHDMEYYQDHPKIFEKLYEGIIKNLEARDKEMKQGNTDTETKK